MLTIALSEHMINLIPNLANNLTSVHCPRRTDRGDSFVLREVSVEKYLYQNDQLGNNFTNFSCDL